MTHHWTIRPAALVAAVALSSSLVGCGTDGKPATKDNSDPTPPVSGATLDPDADERPPIDGTCAPTVEFEGVTYQSGKEPRWGSDLEPAGKLGEGTSHGCHDSSGSESDTEVTVYEINGVDPKEGILVDPYGPMAAAS